jgi:hypothetical protein
MDLKKNYMQYINLSYHKPFIQWTLYLDMIENYKLKEMLTKLHRNAVLRIRILDPVIF